MDSDEEYNEKDSICLIAKQSKEIDSLLRNKSLSLQRCTIQEELPSIHEDQNEDEKQSSKSLKSKDLNQESISDH